MMRSKMRLGPTLLSYSRHPDQIRTIVENEVHKIQMKTRLVELEILQVPYKSPK
jgi:hypothetical protein